MKTKLLMAVVMLLLFCSNSFSHALWIETNSTGTIGEAQEVKIYYGEFAEKEFEESEKWYSDVNAFALWLVKPDGTKQKIEQKAGDHSYVASFTPEKVGSYVLTIGHSAKELGGTTIYQFNASAVVTVNGKSTENTTVINNNELYLQPRKDATGKSGIVTAFFKGKPAGKIKITVSGPEGWSKSFETNENGVLKFDLLWKGVYALEGFYTTEEKGNHYEKPYEKIWRCATVITDFK